MEPEILLLIRLGNRGKDLRAVRREDRNRPRASERRVAHDHLIRQFCIVCGNIGATVGHDVDCVMRIAHRTGRHREIDGISELPPAHVNRLVVVVLDDDDLCTVELPRDAERGSLFRVKGREVGDGDVRRKRCNRALRLGNACVQVGAVANRLRRVGHGVRDVQVLPARHDVTVPNFSYAGVNVCRTRPRGPHVNGIVR